MKNLSGKLLSFLPVTALWLFSSFAMALMPTTGHLPVSRLSFEAFELCFPQDKTFLRDKEIKQRILRANVAMDEGRSALTREDKDIRGERKYFTALNRIDNWHFYNPDKKQETITEQGLIHKSYDRLWSEAKRLFGAHNKAENKVLFLGALMHLLEDTGVPAHVVPVYHGPTVVEMIGEFEKYTDYMQEKGYVSGKGLMEMIKDDIDLMHPDEMRLREHAKSNFTAECNKIKQANIMTPEEIRDEMARFTLDKIAGPISGCKGKNWHIFWNKPVKNEAGEVLKDDYFQAYNTDDDFPLFNHGGLIKSDNGELVCTMQKADARYQEFVYGLHKEMIKNNVRLLRWASREIRQK